MLRNKQIEGLVPMFKANANMLYENASSLQDAIDNGTLSSTGSVASKEVLNLLLKKGVRAQIRAKTMRGNTVLHLLLSKSPSLDKLKFLFRTQQNHKWIEVFFNLFKLDSN